MVSLQWIVSSVVSHGPSIPLLEDLSLFGGSLDGSGLGFRLGTAPTQ